MWGFASWSGRRYGRQFATLRPSRFSSTVVPLAPVVAGSRSRLTSPKRAALFVPMRSPCTPLCSRQMPGAIDAAGAFDAVGAEGAQEGTQGDPGESDRVRTVPWGSRVLFLVSLKRRMSLQKAHTHFTDSAAQKTGKGVFSFWKRLHEVNGRECPPFFT